MCFILDHFYFEEYKDVCLNKKKFVDILLKISFNTIPAFLVYMFSFYCLLHAWMNGFAEMLRFADREFYKASTFICLRAKSNYLHLRLF